MNQAKSARVELNGIRDDEVARLENWSRQNCAVAACIRDGARITWLQTRERARDKQAWMRSVRHTLKRLAIDTTCLKGRNWLAFTSEEVVRQDATDLLGARDQHPSAESDEIQDDADDDARLVALPSVHVACNAEGRRRMAIVDVIKEM